MTSPELALQQSWLALAGPHHDAILRMLLDRHAEPHRRYHTATHVMKVLEHIDTLLDAEPADKDIDDTTDVIRAAGLFHDIVYDPTSSTNEVESADIAVDSMAHVGWSSTRQELLHELIVATAGHEAPNGAAEILLDADLAILGADASTYAEYVDAVRFEYSFVGDDDWRSGRAAILRSFADRERIFMTPTMHNARESQARINLAGELASLVSERSR